MGITSALSLCKDNHIGFLRSLAAGTEAIRALHDKKRELCATMGKGEVVLAAVPENQPKAGGVLILGSKPNKSEAAQKKVEIGASGVYKLGRKFSSKLPTGMVHWEIISPLPFDGRGWDTNYAQMFFPLAGKMIEVTRPSWVVCIDDRAFNALAAGFRHDKLGDLHFRDKPAELTVKEMRGWKVMIVGPGLLYQKSNEPQIDSAVERICKDIQEKNAPKLTDGFSKIMPGSRGLPSDYQSLMGGVVGACARPMRGREETFDPRARVFDLCVEPIDGVKCGAVARPSRLERRDELFGDHGEFSYPLGTVVTAVLALLRQGVGPDTPVVLICDTGNVGVPLALAALLMFLTPTKFSRPEPLLAEVARVLGRDMWPGARAQVAELHKDWMTDIIGMMIAQVPMMEWPFELCARAGGEAKPLCYVGNAWHGAQVAGSAAPNKAWGLAEPGYAGSFFFMRDKLTGRTLGRLYPTEELARAEADDEEAVWEAREITKAKGGFIFAPLAPPPAPATPPPE